MKYLIRDTCSWFYHWIQQSKNTIVNRTEASKWRWRPSHGTFFTRIVQDQDQTTVDLRLMKTGIDGVVVACKSIARKWLMDGIGKCKSLGQSSPVVINRRRWGREMLRSIKNSPRLSSYRQSYAKWRWWWSPPLVVFVPIQFPIGRNQLLCAFLLNRRECFLSESIVCLFITFGSSIRSNESGFDDCIPTTLNWMIDPQGIVIEFY